MVRRQFEEEDQNHERWLISYADFITLLFAFFVVMYSVSSVNQGKYNELSSSISNAFANDENQQLSNEPSTKNTEPSASQAELKKPAPLPSDATMQILQLERDAMTSLGEDLSKQLSPLIKVGNARVMQNSQGLQIDIKDSALFTAGSADLIEAATAMLAEITKPLLLSEHAILVEGHTDDIPIYIKNAALFSNWELSALRASSVVGRLHELGINKVRLSALGFGPSQPISDNATEEGRATNRHISIVVSYDRLSLPVKNSVEIKPILNTP